MTVITPAMARYGIVASFTIGFGMIAMYAMVINGGKAHHQAPVAEGAMHSSEVASTLLQEGNTAHMNINVGFHEFMNGVKTQESVTSKDAGDEDSEMVTFMQRITELNDEMEESLLQEPSADDAGKELQAEEEALAKMAAAAKSEASVVDEYNTEVEPKTDAAQAAAEKQLSVANGQEKAVDDEKLARHEAMVTAIAADMGTEIDETITASSLSPDAIAAAETAPITAPAGTVESPWPSTGAATGSAAATAEPAPPSTAEPASAATGAAAATATAEPVPAATIAPAASTERADAPTTDTDEPTARDMANTAVEGVKDEMDAIHDLLTNSSALEPVVLPKATENGMPPVATLSCKEELSMGEATCRLFFWKAYETCTSDTLSRDVSFALPACRDAQMNATMHCEETLRPCSTDKSNTEAERLRDEIMNSQSPTEAPSIHGDALVTIMWGS